MNIYAIRMTYNDGLTALYVSPKSRKFYTYLAHAKAAYKRLEQKLERYKQFTSYTPEKYRDVSKIDIIGFDIDQDHPDFTIEAPVV